MSISKIVVLAVLAALAGFVPRGRSLVLLFLSALAVYWLATRFDNNSCTFWIPTATLALAVLSWVLTAPLDEQVLWRNLPAFAVLMGVSLLVSLNRYFRIDFFFAIMTPRPSYVIGFWLLLFVGLVVLTFLLRRFGHRFLVSAAIFGVIGLFVLLKSPGLASTLYTLVGLLQGMTTEAVPFLWLGFSYIAFRLLHTFFDRLSGRLPAVNLEEYVTFVIFFPAFAAGPIDRIERFVKDLRASRLLRSADWLEAGRRLFLGLFKKFVLADLLALIPLNAFAPFIPKPGWGWLILYAYAFRLFFDFSGYTDIAIGMGLLTGIRLPENFAAPYLKPNLTQFWNAWHMSLTQWFRAYFFNPLVRRFRLAPRPLPVWFIIALAQFGTMTLIGLWHGISWNYVLWGLWHAGGLFIHNRWSEWARYRVAAWAITPVRKALLNGMGILVTFHYVALGWVFFALATPAQSWSFILKLFGLQ